MKRLLVSLSGLLVLSGLFSLTSCEKEVNSGEREFTASVEAYTDQQGKTFLDGTTIKWDENDWIEIYGLTRDYDNPRRLIVSESSSYTVETNPDYPYTPSSTVRLITGGHSISAPCCAVYPSALPSHFGYGSNISYGQGNWMFIAAFMLPTVQKFVDGSVDEFPMYAFCESGNRLEFKNLCGLLKLHLTKSDEYISSIEVVADSKISGSFCINYNDGDPVLMDDNYSLYSTYGPYTANHSSIKLFCDAPQSIGSGRDFYIYLPAGDYNGLKLVINNCDGRRCVKTANTAISVRRSQFTLITLGENDLNFVAYQPPLHSGELSGLFTINDDGDHVRFSRGNLQYQASSGTWRFANSQYDYVGDSISGSVYENGVKCDNSLISSTYTGWIDLFGWGTGNDPTQNSVGIEHYNTFVDWGVNPISNGGNEPNAWRTLTRQEMDYILQSRTICSNLNDDIVRMRGYARCSICGVNGVLLFPDCYIHPDGVPQPVYPSPRYRWSFYISYTASEWELIEAAGAVFLPAAGWRDNYHAPNPDISDQLFNVNYAGDYWTLTNEIALNHYGCQAYFDCSLGLDTHLNNYYRGCSVRLVRDCD